jgi:hypothetical protein
MLVFGDRSECADPREQLSAIADALRVLAGMPPGIARHSAIAATLIDSGRLLQGVADADFAAMRQDRFTPQKQALVEWVLAIARVLCRSWDSGFAELGEVPSPPEIIDLPKTVELKTPEGFAFYAVYPEAYAEAARRLRLVAPARVIGIRSIGTTLGAVVAAALNARPPVTVRPFGHPYAREIAVDGAMERELLEDDAHFVIVDEGPGQSGSSFGAVADWLQARGVPLERIAFLPSHGEPLGPQASSTHRQRWQLAQREVAEFGHSLPQLVAGWADDVIGSVDAAPKEISGGEWRRQVFASESEWPAAVAMFERRKFLVRSGGVPFLVKFAGLGSTGEDKLRMAQALHEEGFAAEPVGLVHGFLIERWRDDAAPLASDQAPIEEIGRYLGTRARLFPANDADGASIAELYDMAVRNISLALGEEAARALGPWEPRLKQLDRRVRRVRTDNRLDRHEWLRTGGGHLLKTDALDHHQAHDLIGSQDLAWDVAGALTEFDLEGQDVEWLIAASEHASATAVDRELLEFCLIAYAAFRLGLAALGADLASYDPAEESRLMAVRGSYRGAIQRLLQRSSSATRQESLVG